MRNVLAPLFWISSIALLTAALAFAQVKSAPDAEMVLFRVSVVDKKGNIIKDLKQEQFTIKEGGNDQKISYFSDKEEPASVVILLDLSDSIDPPVLRANADGALKFIRESNGQNEYSVIGFDKTVTELAGWKDDGSTIIESIRGAAQAKEKRGNTRLYDAVLLAFEKLKTAGNKKKVLLIFSDGVDNTSKDSVGEVKKALKRNDVIIYTVSTGAGNSASMNGMMGEAFLDEFSIISGGHAYYPITHREADEVIEHIVSVIKNQYVIGYARPEPAKNKDWNSVKIKVAATDANNKKQSFSVRTREGYFVREEN